MRKERSRKQNRIKLSFLEIFKLDLRSHLGFPGTALKRGNSYFLSKYLKRQWDSAFKNDLKERIPGFIIRVSWHELLYWLEQGVCLHRSYRPIFSPGIENFVVWNRWPDSWPFAEKVLLLQPMLQVGLWSEDDNVMGSAVAIAQHWSDKGTSCLHLARLSWVSKRLCKAPHPTIKHLFCYFHNLINATNLPLFWRVWFGENFCRQCERKYWNSHWPKVCFQTF